MRNRVLVLNQFALPRSQGGGTRHADLFGRLENWESMILAGNRNHYTQQRFGTEDASFTLVPVPPQSGGTLQRVVGWTSYSLQALVFALKARPDVVYGSSPHLLAPLTAWAAARILRRPYVLEVRDLWPESFIAAGLLRENSLVHRILKNLEEFLSKNADHIVVVTSGWEEHFARLGADMDRFTVITNGTEPYHLDLSPSQRDELREEFGISGTTAVFAGAHGPKDGIDLILDAARTTPDVNFLLVGSGPVKSQAMQQVSSEGLRNVTFRDPVAKNDLPRLLAACDLGIHAVSPLPVFRLGMSPNKLFDYLAAGLPVVSNAGQPIQRLVGGADIGFIGESNELAEGIRRVVSASPADQGCRRETARRLTNDLFSRRQAAQKLDGVLSSVTETASRKGREKA